jgi:peptidoglycan DL-endopeptidase CwlO
VIGFAVRTTVAAACLLLLAISLQVLAATAQGIAQDLGLLDPPAVARPAGRQPRASSTARADIPPRYLRLYRWGAGRCPGLAWGVLAGVGKVESDHGRTRLPGVRSGTNSAGAAGPMQFGVGVGRAGNAWARYGADYDRDGRVSVYDAGDAIPAAARKLCADGAPRRTDRALHLYNSGRPWCACSAGYVARVRQLARAYAKGGRT